MTSAQSVYEMVPVSLSGRGLQSSDRGLSEWEAVLAEEGSVRSSLLRPILLGFFSLLIGLGGFAFWAVHTDVAAASSASGRIVVDGQTKVVTLLEGGALDKLMVSEGQQVKAGDILLTLQSTRNKARVAQLQEQLFGLDVRLQRLAAEQANRPDFTFVGLLPEEGDARKWQAIVDAEQQIFKQRQTVNVEMQAIDQSLVEQLRNQAQSLKTGNQALKDQIALIQAQRDAISGLVDQQLMAKSQKQMIELNLLQTIDRLQQNESSLTETVQKIAQAQVSLSNRKTQAMRDIAESLQQAQLQRAEMQQDLVSAEDVVAKALVRAPQDGVVANIRFHTPGSAIIGAQPVLDIVPTRQSMLVEANARAQDIDSIALGQAVDIQLSAFGSQQLAPLKGKVTYVAPDSVVNSQTGEATFAVRVQILPGELDKQKSLFLYPGMAAELAIIKGNRTAYAYLTQPIRDSFRRAFREN